MPPSSKHKQPKPRPALVGSMVSLPFEMVGEHRRIWLAKQLSIYPRESAVTFGPKPKEGEEQEPEPVKLWTVDRGNERVMVPLDWGLSFIVNEGAPYLDQRHAGSFQWEPKQYPDPTHPKASPGQQEFADNMLKSIRTNGRLLAEAPTGSGKTVCSLAVIGRLGCPALVIVPSKALADQWVLEAQRHLGLSYEEVGLIQGARADWRGRKITIAVIHNLFMKEWSEDFFAQFGTVAWDECHRVAAPEFSKTMPLFSARFRFGVTATPDRKDGCMPVITSHLGPVRVRSEAEALACECRVIKYHDPFAKKYANAPLPILLKVLTKNNARNAVIVDRIAKLYNRERHTLVLSDRIEHLQTLQSMAVKAGVDKDRTALYVGSYKVGGKTKTTGQGYLRAIREDKSIKVIFATYAMMKEGTDIPHLDAGIDATPRADGTQAIGRIRRPFPNKPLPVWFTLIDSAVPLLLGFARARLREYESCNVTIFE